MQFRRIGLLLKHHFKKNILCCREGMFLIDAAKYVGEQSDDVIQANDITAVDLTVFFDDIDSAAAVIAAVDGG